MTRVAPPTRQGTPDPATPPDGWHSGPPDYCIVGAPKCGTTRWYQLLRSHPRVFGAYRPWGPGELHFYDDFYDHWPTPEDHDRYRRYFPRPAGAIAGDKAPTYLSQEWVPAMFAEAAPEARILVLVRDPVERFQSARTFNERWRESTVSRGRTSATFTRFVMARSFDHGLYAEQLGWLLQAFPRERILVQQFERTLTEPLPELARAFAFLGVEPYEPDPLALDKQHNRTRSERIAVEPRHLERIRAQFRPDVECLRELVPDLDLSLWPNFRDMA